MVQSAFLRQSDREMFHVPQHARVHYKMDFDDLLDDLLCKEAVNVSKEGSKPVSHSLDDMMDSALDELSVDITKDPIQSNSVDLSSLMDDALDDFDIDDIKHTAS